MPGDSEIWTCIAKMKKTATRRGRKGKENTRCARGHGAAGHTRKRRGRGVGCGVERGTRSVTRMSIRSSSEPPRVRVVGKYMVGNLLRRAFVNLMRQRSSMPSVSLRLRVCFIRSSCSYVLTLFHHRNEGSAVPILTSLRAFALSSFTAPSDSHAPTNSRRRRPSLGWRFCCSHQLVFAGVARMGRMWPHVTC
jgi:hypothetical protein